MASNVLKMPYANLVMVSVPRGSRRLSKKGAIQNTDAGEREACSTCAGTGCEEVTDHHPVQG